MPRVNNASHTRSCISGLSVSNLTMPATRSSRKHSSSRRPGTRPAPAHAAPAVSSRWLSWKECWGVGSRRSGLFAAALLIWRSRGQPSLCPKLFFFLKRLSSQHNCLLFQLDPPPQHVLDQWDHIDQGRVAAQLGQPAHLGSREGMGPAGVSL